MQTQKFCQNKRQRAKYISLQSFVGKWGCKVVYCTLWCWHTHTKWCINGDKKENNQYLLLNRDVGDTQTPHSLLGIRTGRWLNKLSWFYEWKPTTLFKDRIQAVTQKSVTSTAFPFACPFKIFVWSKTKNKQSYCLHVKFFTHLSNI